MQPYEAVSFVDSTHVTRMPRMPSLQQLRTNEWIHRTFWPYSYNITMRHWCVTTSQTTHTLMIIFVETCLRASSNRHTTVIICTHVVPVHKQFTGQYFITVTCTRDSGESKSLLPDNLICGKNFLEQSKGLHKVIHRIYSLTHSHKPDIYWTVGGI